MAKNISLSGDIVGSGTFNNAGNTEISCLKKMCHVARSAHPAHLYAKIAEYTITVPWKGVCVTLNITDVQNANAVGVLTVSVISDGGINVNNANILWLRCTNASKMDKFKLAYKKTDSGISFQIFVDLTDNTYSAYHIQQEQAYGIAIFETPTYLSALPDEYRIITSAPATLQNPIANDLLPYNGNMPATADFNDYIIRGWYSNGGTNSGQTNVPHSADNGHLLVFGNTAKCRQVWIGSFALSFKTRTKNNDTWSTWVDII